MPTYQASFYALTTWQQRIAKATVPLTAQIAWPGITLQHDKLTSGLAVEVGSEWFWVTADHSLKAIRELLEKFPNSTLVLHGSGDETGDGVIISIPDRDRFFLSSEDLPAVIAEGGLEPEQVAVLVEQSKLDVAFIHLSELYVRSLKAIGVVPFSYREVWQNHSEETIARLRNSGGVVFFFAGLPASTIKYSASGVMESWALKFLQITHDSIEEPTILFKPMWPEGVHAGSVVGMSGGPVVAVSLADNSVYWLGVQSSELTHGRELAKVRVAPALFAYDLMCGMVEIEPSVEE